MLGPQEGPRCEPLAHLAGLWMRLEVAELDQVAWIGDILEVEVDQAEFGRQRSA